MIEFINYKWLNGLKLIKISNLIITMILLLFAPLEQDQRLYRNSIFEIGYQAFNAVFTKGK